MRGVGMYMVHISVCLSVFMYEEPMHMLYSFPLYY